MRSAFVPFSWLMLLAVAAVMWPFEGHAQAFSASYGFSRPATTTPGLDAPVRSTLLDLGPIRIGPSLLAGGRASGAGLSFEAGRNWFGLVGVGRSLNPGLTLPGAVDSSAVLSLSGGYRWSDGQSLSLELSGGRGKERLGLSVSYDWPRYFVRLAYDSKIDLVPQDRLRFSAGMRF